MCKANFISLCSHTDAHPNLNREVCHSPTWHSSKSESALERFEPVAAAMLWSDGRGTLFAPVAARRPKVFKRGIDTYAKHVCRRRRDGSQYFPLFVLFILFGQAKRTLTEKFLYVSLRETNGLPYNLNPSTSINKQPAPHNAYIEKHLVFAEKFPQKILLPAVKAFRQGTEVLI